MNTKDKVYRLYGINTAMHLLRPGAKWEISNNYFSRWEDSRPCPTMDEVHETMEKIKAFEESINTIWTDDQLKEMGVQMQEMEDAIEGKTKS